MAADKEYDFSMVAGEFVEVYSKKEGKITQSENFRTVGLCGYMFLY